MISLITFHARCLSTTNLLWIASALENVSRGKGYPDNAILQSRFHEEQNTNGSTPYQTKPWQEVHSMRRIVKIANNHVAWGEMGFVVPLPAGKDEQATFCGYWTRKKKIENGSSRIWIILSSSWLQAVDLISHHLHRASGRDGITIALARMMKFRRVSEGNKEQDLNGWIKFVRGAWKISYIFS
jgi:hypothetical protein